MSSYSKMIVQGLTQNYIDHRDEILRKDERGIIINSPLNCLRSLARQYKIIISISNNMIVQAGTKKKTWVCVVKAGLFEGIGRADMDYTARELAAADLLHQMVENGTELQERCGLAPGFEISTLLYGDLNRLARDRHYKKEPFFESEPNKPIELRKDDTVYTIICKLGEHVTEGKSDDLAIAKLLAAKKMYEEIMGNGVEYPYMVLKAGKEALYGFYKNLPLSLPKFTPRLKKLQDEQLERAGFNVEKEEEEKIMDGEFVRPKAKIDLKDVMNLRKLPLKRTIRNDQYVPPTKKPCPTPSFS